MDRRKISDRRVAKDDGKWGTRLVTTYRGKRIEASDSRRFYDRRTAVLLHKRGE